MGRDIALPRSIRYLMAVAEQRSFTRAAEVLYVSQPTLSQQIKQLEDLLEVQLLDRSGRSVRVTAAGEAYLRHARRALGELDAAKRAVHALSNLENGSLRLGMTPITDYLAIPLVEQFNARHPGIAVEMLEMPQHEISDALAEDRIDLGIALTSNLAKHDQSDEVETHILFFETLSLLVGREHPLKDEAAPLNESVLEEVPLVLFTKDYALRRHIDRCCAERNVDLKVAIEATSLSVILELVRFGRLATILPDVIGCVQPELQSIPLVPEMPGHTITLTCRNGQYKSPACQAFGELAVEWAQSRCLKDPPTRVRPCPLPELCAHTDVQRHAEPKALGKSDVST